MRDREEKQLECPQEDIAVYQQWMARGRRDDTSKKAALKTRGYTIPQWIRSEVSRSSNDCAEKTTTRRVVMDAFDFRDSDESESGHRHI
jgi:hypothetical protein